MSVTVYLLMSFWTSKPIDNYFDRLVLATILGLGIAIATILGHGNQSRLQVQDFSWSGQKIGVKDRYFTLTFNRPGDRRSLADNLVINPPLRGKISWTGNTLVYTLTELPVYGIAYAVQIEDDSQALKPFIGTFQSRDRAYVYIGVSGPERGKLILGSMTTTPGNLTQLKKTTLTPNDLIVTDFAIYPAGDKILFSAREAASSRQETSKQELYTVTTGLSQPTGDEKAQSGKVKRFLDGNTYQDLKFALSDNGQTVVVLRENQRNPADASLWVIAAPGEARPLGMRAEEFKIAPDGQTLAINQGGGVAFIPLIEGAGSPQFLPNYERILGFSADSASRWLVRKNSDETRSLHLVNAAGKAKLILNSKNPLIDCELEPRQKQTLYCLKTDLVSDQNGQVTEEPFLSIIDLAKTQDIPLLALPNYRDVQMSMSPDGVALLFDQVVTTPFPVNDDLVTASGKTIADGRLWLLPLPESINAQTPQTITPQELNPGFKPRWLP